MSISIAPYLLGSGSRYGYPTAGRFTRILVFYVLYQSSSLALLFSSFAFYHVARWSIVACHRIVYPCSLSHPSPYLVSTRAKPILVA